ncbi:GNAT family N-acetyltransferase [Flavobacterium pectinovorum]|uniref:Acetyltransferase (GNAT) family protein n=1 Tax=Flavobacterium pectinovorum TaxID=29533 RepID=A0AB36P6B4_9FLAO|nr:GNAT family N-acetyltransferase [Flavobacterium pectinovorum]OXB07716.1 GNAT family N-acetyltransferase [Flavobacterium pectinovorum]SHM77802.1 Acetyltransferase (GNAT) family protein [Flavobacterium pectinovorum]
MTETISIKITNPNEKVAAIIDELSANLYLRFGSDGKNSFTDWQQNNSKYVFVVAEIKNEIVGCGAIRPISETVGEVKRMYSKYPRKKIGKTILAFLEDIASKSGYEELILETRIKNTEATQFYEKQNYKVIPNYGKYKDRPEAICFGKSLK